MVKQRILLMALLVTGVCLVCFTFASCVPTKVPTSEKGSGGLPTAKYDRGTPPPKWEIDRSELPVYPNSKKFDNWRTYITPDPISDVIAYYEGALPDAQVTKPEGSNAVTTFKTLKFILSIQPGDGDNTLITFSRPEE